MCINFRLLIELAKHLGVKTINVVRRDDVKKELKALGADEVINSETEGAYVLQASSSRIQCKLGCWLKSVVGWGAIQLWELGRYCFTAAVLLKLLTVISIPVGYASFQSAQADVVARVKEITGGKLAYAAVDAVLGKLTKVSQSLVFIRMSLIS